MKIDICVRDGETVEGIGGAVVSLCFYKKPFINRNLIRIFMVKTCEDGSFLFKGEPDCCCDVDSYSFLFYAADYEVFHFQGPLSDVDNFKKDIYLDKINAEK